MPSRTELQTALQQSRERFNAAVDGTDPSTLENQAVCGVWSSRDVAGHLADWNDELLAAAEFGTGRLPEARPLVEDGEAYNTSHAEARKSQSWSEARADLDASFDRVSSVLEDLDEEQLSAAATMPWGVDGTVGEVFADITGHVNEHVANLENGLTR